MKINQADRMFARCIKERACWRCERCGKQYAEGSMGLHCSHNFSRRHRTVRWCKENALALCFSCHQWYGGCPPDSALWLEKKLGVQALEILREKMSQKIKVSKEEEKEIAAHYRAQLEEMKKKRRAGNAGYLDFISWQ